MEYITDSNLWKSDLMMSNLCHLLRSIPSLRAFSTAAASEQPTIYASCVLARAPVVTTQPEDWEIKYKSWAAEIRGKNDLILPAVWQKTKAVEEEDDSPSTVHWEESPRITEADKTGDMQSLMRALDQYLYFVVKNKDGHWEFPSTKNVEGETIRQTGERALGECITPADTFFIANWPIAHFRFESGRIEYYMKAQLLTGKVTLSGQERWTDFAWIARSELANYFKNEALQKLLGRALV